MSKIREILKLTRNPKAPDVKTLKPYKNGYGFWRRDCPKCGEQQKDDGFYGHWTLKHDPDWKLNLVLDWHKAEVKRIIGEDEPKLYDHDGDIAEHRNELRSEQRKRAGL